MTTEQEDLYYYWLKRLATLLATEHPETLVFHAISRCITNVHMSIGNL